MTLVGVGRGGGADEDACCRWKRAALTDADDVGWQWKRDNADDADRQWKRARRSC